MIFEHPMELEGRLLDSAVHEDGFGRRVAWGASACEAGRSPCDAETRTPVPDYSERAWNRVLDRLEELGYEVTLREKVVLGSGLEFGVEARATGPDGVVHRQWAPTLPVAICRLALALLHRPEDAH